MIQFACEKGFTDLVLNATSQFLDIPWQRINNKDVSILEAQAHFMRAQALVTQNVFYFSALVINNSVGIRFR